MQCLETNQLVFQEQPLILTIFWHLYTASLLWSITICFEIPLVYSENNHVEIYAKWYPPPSNSFHLNIDGSHYSAIGLLACRGLTKDSEGRFIRGFVCILSRSTSISAEP